MGIKEKEEVDLFTTFNKSLTQIINIYCQVNDNNFIFSTIFQYHTGLSSLFSRGFLYNYEKYTKYEFFKVKFININLH